MYYVYILVSESSGAFYVGQTRNLSDRLRRHNSGRSRYTRGQGPWQLAYAERFPSRSAAVRREMELKSRHSREFLTNLVDGSKGEVG